MLHDVTELVHGHTHRPAIHPLQLGSRAGRRAVLGDWYTQGSFLEWSPRGPELQDLPFSPRG